MRRRLAAVGGLVVMSLLPGLRPAMAQATADARPAAGRAVHVPILGRRRLGQCGGQGPQRPIRAQHGSDGFHRRRIRAAATDSRFSRRGGRPGEGGGAFRYQRQHARRIEGGRRAAGGAAHPRRAPAERRGGGVLLRHPSRSGHAFHLRSGRARARAGSRRGAVWPDLDVRRGGGDRACGRQRRVRRRPSSATECRHRADRRHRHSQSSHARTGRRDFERHRRTCLYPRRDVADRRPRGRTAAAKLPGPLSNLARWTGGEFFPGSAPAHASVAARQIVDELRHQYVLAFEASTRPGWRPLEVRTRDRDLVCTRPRRLHGRQEQSGKRNVDW